MFSLSDWGTSAWAEDVDAAQEQAEAWIAQAASARSWPSSMASGAQGLAAAAADGAITAQDYWTALGAGWARAGRLTDDEGWHKLGETFAQAADTAQEVSASREQGTLAEVLEQGAAGALDDYKRYAPYAAAGGLLIFGLWVWSRKPRAR